MFIKSTKDVFLLIAVMAILLHSFVPHHHMDDSSSCYSTNHNNSEISHSQNNTSHCDTCHVCNECHALSNIIPEVTNKNTNTVISQLSPLFVFMLHTIIPQNNLEQDIDKYFFLEEKSNYNLFLISNHSLRGPPSNAYINSFLNS